MSTDFQKARDALGSRLRELRTAGRAGRLTGPQLGERLGWPHSKIYKLENGRQTANAADLQAWAEATGCPDAAAELQAHLQGLESHVRSWRRQLAKGHRPVQDAITAEHARTTTLYIWENSLIPGMVQTPDYARAVFTRHAQLCAPRRTPRRRYGRGCGARKRCTTPAGGTGSSCGRGLYGPWCVRRPCWLLSSTGSQA